MSSKNLHKHSLPILMIGVAGVIASAAIAGTVATGHGSGDVFASALTQRTLSVKTTSIATAQVSLVSNVATGNVPQVDSISLAEDAVLLHMVLSQTDAQ